MNYKRIHDQIIKKAKNSNRAKGDGNYYEAHHIIPKCMGGEGKESQWRTHPNIVLLTAKEHFVIHKLLCEIYPDNPELIYTYWLFVNGCKKNKSSENNYNVGAKEYERIKTTFGISMSKRMCGEKNHMFGRTGEKNHMFGRTGKNHPLFGSKRTEEQKQKMRGENHPMFGKKCPWVIERNKSEKSRQNLRQKMAGEKNHMFGKSSAMAGMTGEKHPTSKKIICIVTNKIYVSIKEAAEDNGVNLNTLRGYLRGNRPNKTSLRYL